MKPIFMKVFAGVAVAAVCAPLFTSALSVQELQAQVQVLMQKMAALQQGGASASGSTSVSASSMPAQHRVCGVLNRSLGVGSRGDDVMSLQEFLKEQGYLSANATGFYGVMTARAVAQWQSSQGIAAVGRIGPSSREHIRVWCGSPIKTNELQASPVSGSAPLTVTFSTNISGFRINTVSYLIDFGDGSTEKPNDCNAPADACITPGLNTHTYTANGTYNAVLYRMTDPCAGNNFCRAAIMREEVGRITITVGGAATCKPINYMPIACSDGSAAQPKHNESGCITGYECPMANYTPPASCKAWNDGCNECSRTSPDAPAACTLRACIWAGKGYCSIYFDGPTSTNKPPVISGISGPTTLSVNQAGTWAVQASDPENGNLTYLINWGDVNTAAPLAANMQGSAFVQTSTFTHVYTSAGTYTVTVTVRDSAGQSAQTTSTVQVGGAPVACTMEYAPVCGQPPMYCPAGMYCAQVMPAPVTYGNRCQMNAAGATLIHEGAC